MTQRGYWRVATGEQVTLGEAIAAWSTEAYPTLEKVAGTYQALITYGDLAEIVQGASGISTTVPIQNWIGRVLALIVHEGHRRGDPPLTALVVHKTDGRVGEGYKLVLQVAGEPPIEDDIARERHAAAARLECYRHFGAALPPDGGEPTLAPALQEYAASYVPPAPGSPAPARRSSSTGTATKRKAPAPPPKLAAVCPSCFMQLPATGVCDSCG